jgi:hypothetical protein
MKIGDFPVVEALVDARTRLINWKDKGHIAIEIDGGRMSPEFVAAIEPAIHLELRHHIQDLDARLRSLGVDVP